MALAVDQTVTPKTIYPSSGPGVGLPNGMLTDFPLLGTVTNIQGAPNIAVDWNNGTVADGTLNPFVQATSLRRVDVGVAAAALQLFGKTVRLTLNNASGEYTGQVVSVFQLEVATTNNTGALSDVAVVRTRAGLFFIALVSDLEQVVGQ